MAVGQVICEDLKAFERRLTEVISCTKPTTNRWRILFAAVTICTAVGAYYWLCDPSSYDVSMLESLCHHRMLAVSFISLVILLMLGIHKKIAAPVIIADRARLVLAEFNMSCDNNGKLILKPRYVN